MKSFNLTSQSKCAKKSCSFRCKCKKFYLYPFHMPILQVVTIADRTQQFGMSDHHAQLASLPHCRAMSATAIHLQIHGTPLLRHPRYDPAATGQPPVGSCKVLGKLASHAPPQDLSEPRFVLASGKGNTTAFGDGVGGGGGEGLRGEEGSSARCLRG
jgi:hypothetical protein